METLITLDTPPTSDPDLGASCLEHGFGYLPRQVTSGPNQGYWYIDDAHANGTKFSFLVNPHLNPEAGANATEFCRAQCGTANEISCLNLKNNVIRHEQGDWESHWRNYVVAQDDPQNNYGIGAEEFTRPPPLTESQFRQFADAAFRARIDAITQLTEVHPLGPNYFADGTTVQWQGTIDWPPYNDCWWNP